MKRGVCGQSFPFTYNPLTRKGVGAGLKIALNQRTGTLTITLKNVNLQDCLEEAGANNGSNFGTSVNVPVSVVFGTGALGLSTTIPYSYFSIANKVGTGKY